jgi:hypothetical protein
VPDHVWLPAGIMGADLEGVPTMRLAYDPRSSEVDLTASAEELSRFAGAVANGEGLLSSTAAVGSNALVGVEVKQTSGWSRQVFSPSFGLRCG